MQNFNFHQHTYRCGHADNNMQDEDYVKDYLDMGFKKIAFTDHCPEKERIDPMDNVRMDYSQKEEYLQSISNLKEKYKDKIQILSGYEIEFLPGQEENLKELKDESDILVLGQHFIYNKDGKTLKRIHDDKYDDEDLDTYANYIETAVKLGLPDIIAHPDIYMRARESFDKKAEEVARRICEVAIKYNIPIEINLNNIFNRVFLNETKTGINNYSLEEQYKRFERIRYPDANFWKVVSEYDVKVVYGIDTHFANQIPKYKELVNLSTKIIGQETIDKLNFIKEL